MQSSAEIINRESAEEIINRESSVALAETKEEEMSKSKKLMMKIRVAGTACVISYALWELGFSAISVPIRVFGYRQVTG